MDAFQAADFLPVLYAFVGCCAWAVTFNTHGWEIPLSALGGALGWLVYLLSAPLVGSGILQAFVAAVALSLYCEVMARVRKCPTTSYLLISIFPRGPGAGIYYTMEYAIRGEMEAFWAKGGETLGYAGALALGILLVSSFTRMWTAFHMGRKQEGGRAE